MLNLYIGGPMKKALKQFFSNEEAQGAVEYVLLLVVVVGLVVLFRSEIEDQVRDLIGRLGQDISQF